MNSVTDAQSAQKNMTDFHTHILPRMDDGSQSTAESVHMLKASCNGSVSRLVLTPHFYPDRESLEHFLERRERAADMLCGAVGNSSGIFPEILLGAEVAYFGGISRMNRLEDLGVRGSKLILLEMPFCAWTEHMLEEVGGFSAATGLTPLLAHAERYRNGGGRKRMFQSLRDSGVRYQVNASFFCGINSPSAFRMLKRGEIAALGSDCHNMTARKPGLQEAEERIQKRMGPEMVNWLNEEADRLLGKAEHEENAR